jgi:glycosyltransferase involved in cell wall biosynthesis
MKLSIITVVYNRVGCIERALYSLQSQDYPDIEHIVVDGGSTDGTLEKLKACLDSSAVLVSEPDRGLYDAINKGLRLATGDVIGILHSDDYFDNNHILSKVMAKFCDSSIDAVFGDAEYFASEAPNRIVRRYSSKNFKISRLGWGWMPAHTTLFLRRVSYLEIGEYSLDYTIAADFDFVCRAFHLNRITYTYIPKVLVKMQIGGLSSASLRNTLTLNKEVMRACKKNNIHTNWIKLLSKYPIKILEFF